MSGQQAIVRDDDIVSDDAIVTDVRSAIRKFLSPIFVALPSGLPRWIVQYSRMILSSPISLSFFVLAKTKHPAVAHR